MMAAVANSFAPGLQGFLDAIKKLNIPNFLVIAIDKPLADNLKEQGFPFYYKENAAQGNHKVSAQKFSLLKEFVAVGCSVLLTDTDVVYLQNPFGAWVHRVHRVGCAASSAECCGFGSRRRSALGGYHASGLGARRDSSYHPSQHLTCLRLVHILFLSPPLRGLVQGCGHGVDERWVGPRYRAWCVAGLPRLPPYAGSHRLLLSPLFHLFERRAEIEGLTLQRLISRLI